jgi:hypothetical protein
VVKAKHARWPPRKLQYLRTGVERLDALVEANPNVPDVRYLRLVSCYYLPFFLKREESVEADFRALIAELPKGSSLIPPAIYRGIIQFVLDNGEMTQAERARLEEALG